ncbi:MAG: hypothetical protein HZC55_12370 [Verrucomicrobia bacterium]|jgi:hypothetical protein|nr:hypothetical protein [Verrucomicrobiota bacterium]
MKRLAPLNTPAWRLGLALAAAGVLLARLVAPRFSSSAQPGLALVGELLALAGLAVIAAGVSRRIRGGAPT